MPEKLEIQVKTVRLLHFQKESLSDVQLHLAAMNGDLTTLKKILDSGKVHVDCKDKVSITTRLSYFFGPSDLSLYGTFPMIYFITVAC